MDAYEPFQETGERVLKTMDAFLRKDGGSALIECLAIEEGTKRSFFAEVSDRDDGVVIRLAPLTDPEKTDGVKTILARLALGFKERVPGFEVGKTNLQEQLGAVAPGVV